jgi:CO/xanthine dehydrogenase Mo-binding subunit
VISDSGADAQLQGSKTLTASYSKPYISHASIGPSCALARFERDKLTVWSHSQGIFNLRRDLSLALDMAESAIVVRHAEGAGCYGHNGADDVAPDAAMLARAAGSRPVRVQWMRDDEFSWARGPAMKVELRAARRRGRERRRLQHDLWEQRSQQAGRSAGPRSSPAGIWRNRTSALPRSICRFRRERRTATRSRSTIFPTSASSTITCEMPVRVGAALRVGPTPMCSRSSRSWTSRAAAGVDPSRFACGICAIPRACRPRSRRAARSGRGRSREEGRGQGASAFAKYKNIGAYCAVVAAVEVGHEVRALRLTLAVDVGLVVNPDGVRNQIEGGAIQSTSWTLKEQVKLGEFGIACLGWEDYPILKFSEVPKVEIELIDRPDLPSVGAGEAAQGPTAAAIANAVENALGVRVRDLPLSPERIIAAIERQ